MSAQIEAPPALTAKEKLYILRHPADAQLEALLRECNARYAYWTDIKYRHKALEEPLTPRLLWGYLKSQRRAAGIAISPRYGLRLFVTVQMQGQLYELDQLLQADRFVAELIPPAHKRRYLMSALMEEAIRSSQIEGAATTRRVAKEMLRKNITPRDRSQRMILNNYRTMALLQEQRDAEMTEELLLQIHRSMVRGTLERTADEGRFRTAEDEVYVEHQLTHEVVHTPPPAPELADFMQLFLSLCNDREQPTFIHPILRGIIIHFLIGYMHPFVDGNGRTARALFYWYMLRSGYSLLEYLSISQVIYKGKSQYEEAYLKVETDDLDLGYFVQYHLRVLRLSIESFKSYAEQKLKEQECLTPILRIGGLNERQMQILRLYQESESLVLTGREVEQRFGVSQPTAKSDLKGLVERGFLDEIAYNKVKRGYLKSSHFDELLDEASVR